MDRNTAKKIATAALPGLNSLSDVQRVNLLHPVAELIAQGMDIKAAIDVAVKGRRSWALTQGWSREAANGLALMTLLAATARYAAEIVAAK